MAHWAEIDENSIVVNVTVGDNNDPNGDEGYQWLVDNLGGAWIKTSYNATIRKKFAGIGDYYDAELDVFIPQKPFESWVFNEDSWMWEIPFPKPDNVVSEWSESAVRWVEKPTNGIFEWSMALETWIEAPDSGYAYFDNLTSEWVEINNDSDSLVFDTETKRFVKSGE